MLSVRKINSKRTYNNYDYRRILHTVGPTYRAAFITAAEHALYSCYHNCLSTAMEEQCTSLAFTCLYSHAKGYPRKAATHIALRKQKTNYILIYKKIG